MKLERISPFQPLQVTVSILFSWVVEDSPLLLCIHELSKHTIADGNVHGDLGGPFLKLWL